MAVIISNGNTSLATASGFYRVEAYNVGSFNISSATALQLGSAKQLNVTFANAGNCLGIVLAPFSYLTGAGQYTPYTRPITVDLENYASVTCDSTNEQTTWAAHGFSDGQQVSFTAASIPGGITAGATYFARATDTTDPTNKFFIYDTAAHAIAGGATGKVNITSNGTTVVCGAVRATKTRTAAQITNNSTYTNGVWLTPFVFTSSYAVDTTASKWRFNIYQGAGVSTWYLNSSDGTNLTYATWCDTAVTFSTGNDFVIAKDIVTIDKTATLKAYLGTGDAANGVCGWSCTSVNPSTQTAGNFVWEFPAAGAYTLTLDGRLVSGSQGGFRIGQPITFTGTLAAAATSGTLNAVWGFTTGTYQIHFSCGDKKSVTLTNGSTAVSWTGGLTGACTAFNMVANPVATKATISCLTTPTVGSTLGSFSGVQSNSYVNDTRGTFIFCGEVPAGYSTTLTGDANAGQKVVDVADASGFTAGNTVFIMKENVTGNGDYNTVNTIASIVGNRITLTNNISGGNRLSGGQFFKSDGFGVDIIPPALSNTLRNWYMYNPSNFWISGVQCQSFQIIMRYLSNQTYINLDDDSACSQWHISDVVSWYNVSQQYFISNMSPPPKGFYCQRLYTRGLIPFITVSRLGYKQGAINYFSGTLTVKNCVAMGYNANSFSGASTTLLKIDCQNSYFYQISYEMGGLNCTYKNNMVWGATTGRTITNLYYPLSISGNTIDKCTTGTLFGSAYFTASCFESSDVYGSMSANTNDLAFSADGFIDYTATSDTVSTVDVTNQAYAAPGSKLRFLNYNTTANDNRSWFTLGSFVSSGTTKIIATCSQTASSLVNSYTYSSKAVTGYPIYFSVNVKIGNAAYYAGVNTLPNMTLYYDAGTTSAAASAFGNTNQQNVSAIITPTTDNNNILVQLNQKTDSSIANSAVTWDTVISNLRKYGYTFQDFTTTWNQTLDTIQQTFITPTTNPYITVSNKATVAAYGEFTINHATQTVTISASTTLKRLYDYSQYDLAADGGLNSSYAQWFTTLDGVNFTSTYNIVLNTGVNLTGGGSVNVGAMTFTKTGTATYNGIIITSTNRVVHVQLIGTVSGSSYYIAKVSDGTVLISGTASGDTNDLYTYTADMPVVVKARKSDYIPVSYNGTITSVGLSLNVNQVADTIHA